MDAKARRFGHRIDQVFEGEHGPTKRNNCPWPGNEWGRPPREVWRPNEPRPAHSSRRRLRAGGRSAACSRRPEARPRARSLDGWGRREQAGLRRRCGRPRLRFRPDRQASRRGYRRCRWRVTTAQRRRLRWAQVWKGGQSPRSTRSSTPLSRAFAWRSSRALISVSPAATTSLPMRRCGMPRSAQ